MVARAPAVEALPGSPPLQDTVAGVNPLQTTETRRVLYEIEQPCCCEALRLSLRVQIRSAMLNTPFFVGRTAGGCARAGMRPTGARGSGRDGTPSELQTRVYPPRFCCILAASCAAGHFDCMASRPSRILLARACLWSPGATAAPSWAVRGALECRSILCLHGPCQTRRVLCAPVWPAGCSLTSACSCVSRTDIQSTRPIFLLWNRAASCSTSASTRTAVTPTSRRQMAHARLYGHRPTLHHQSARPLRFRRGRHVRPTPPAHLMQDRRNDAQAGQE